METLNGYWSLGGIMKYLNNYLKEAAPQSVLGIFLNKQQNTIVIFSILHRQAETLNTECSKTSYKQHPELTERLTFQR